MSDRTYWNNNGKYQSEYNQMLKAEEAGLFTFTKTALKLFHSYYRYYNDGDLPGWARGDYKITQYGRWGKELNEYGESLFEEKVNERILMEWKRFNKKC